MTIELWIVYLFAAIGLSLTPGPNSLLALTHGLRFGLKPTIATVVGGVCGCLLIIAGSLAGMGALLVTSELLFTLAKWLGALYLIYLGVRLLRSPVVFASAMRLSRNTGARTRLALFSDGFFVALSNPKLLLFFAAFLPQFMRPGVPYWLNLLVFGGTFAVIELLYEIALAGMAQRIAPWLGRHGRWLNRITGLTFIGIGGLLTGSGR